jgi:5-methylcytosine-specific restriction endonuclease McrA
MTMALTRCWTQLAKPERGHAARRAASPGAVRAEQWLNGGDGLYLLSSKSFNVGRDQALFCVSRYCELLRIMQNGKCFYDENHDMTSSEVDHLLPWSFVLEDKTWNLVLACHKCNNEKRDRLTNKEALGRLCARNEKIAGKQIDIDHFTTSRSGIRAICQAISKGYTIKLLPTSFQPGNKGGEGRHRGLARRLVAVPRRAVLVMVQSERPHPRRANRRGMHLRATDDSALGEHVEIVIVPLAG